MAQLSSNELCVIPIVANAEGGTGGDDIMVNRGKGPTKGVTNKRSKRQTGVEKGKKKVILTGHKATPKAIWIKRGVREVCEEQKAGKKPRVAELEIFEVEDKEVTTEEGCTDKDGQTVEDNVAPNEKKEAGLGEDQLRQQE